MDTKKKTKIRTSVTRADTGIITQLAIAVPTSTAMITSKLFTLS